MNNDDDITPGNPADLADQGYSAAGEVVLIKARRTFLENIWRGLKSAPPTALFGLTVITIYIFFALFAPLLAPHGEAEIFDLSYAPWGEEFMFGTDQLGRDILSRLIYGARNTVGIAFVTTLFAFIIGGGLGITAAINNNGWLDNLLSRSVDVLMAIPSLIFALILLSMFGANTLNLIIIIAILDSTRVFRIARAVSLNVVVMDYVEAARLRGEKLFWILYREILPNIMPPLVAEFGLRFCFAFFPWRGHSATDRRLGFDGARNRRPDPVCRVRYNRRDDADVTGSSHCATYGCG
jgi:peptide/nickel transport system permease protein